jgi:hypothetical protein
MLIVLIAAVFLGWQANKAREQREAVEAVQRLWRVGPLPSRIRQRQADTRSKPLGTALASQDARRRILPERQAGELGL